MNKKNSSLLNQKNSHLFAFKENFGSAAYVPTIITFKPKVDKDDLVIQKLRAKKKAQDLIKQQKQRLAKIKKLEKSKYMQRQQEQQKLMRNGKNYTYNYDGSILSTRRLKNKSLPPQGLQLQFSIGNTKVSEKDISKSTKITKKRLQKGFKPIRSLKKVKSLSNKRNYPKISRQDIKISKIKKQREQVPQNIYQSQTMYESFKPNKGVTLIQGTRKKQSQQRFISSITMEQLANHSNVSSQPLRMTREDYLNLTSQGNLTRTDFYSNGQDEIDEPYNQVKTSYGQFSQYSNKKNNNTYYDGEEQNEDFDYFSKQKVFNSEIPINKQKIYKKYGQITFGQTFFGNLEEIEEEGIDQKLNAKKSKYKSNAYSFNLNKSYYQKSKKRKLKQPKIRISKEAFNRLFNSDQNDNPDSLENQLREMRKDLKVQKQREREQKNQLAPTSIDIFNNTILQNKNWGGDLANSRTPPPLEIQQRKTLYPSQRYNKRTRYKDFGRNIVKTKKKSFQNQLKQFKRFQNYRNNQKGE